jgi:hypothetical protein
MRCLLNSRQHRRLRRSDLQRDAASGVEWFERSPFHRDRVLSQMFLRKECF